jgi:predicted GNAT family acetyltransferase
MTTFCKVHFVRRTPHFTSRHWNRVGAVSEIVVLDETDKNQYTILVDGKTAGLAAYRFSDGKRVMDRTEIDPAFAGQGVGSALAEGALTKARASGEPIVPMCPFIARYIRKHPEWRAIVDPATLVLLDKAED